jgi:hypothetical protein
MSPIPAIHGSSTSQHAHVFHDSHDTMQESSAPKLPPVATEMPEQSTSPASGLEIVHKMFPHLDHKTISDALIAKMILKLLSITYLPVMNRVGTLDMFQSVIPHTESYKNNILYVYIVFIRLCF